MHIYRNVGGDSEHTNTLEVTQIAAGLPAVQKKNNTKESRGAPGSSSCLLGARFAAEVHTGNTAPKNRPAHLIKLKTPLKVHVRLKPDETNTADKKHVRLSEAAAADSDLYHSDRHPAPAPALKNTQKNK